MPTIPTGHDFICLGAVVKFNEHGHEVFYAHLCHHEPDKRVTWATEWASLRAQERHMEEVEHVEHQAAMMPEWGY